MLKIISNTGYVFDLYEDTVITIEENSPIFTGKGSFSTPLSLPATPGNLEALSFPDRYQRREKFKKSFDVSVSAGAYHRLAIMKLESAASKSNISVVLYFRESGFYQKMRDSRIQDLFKDIVKPINSVSFLNHCNKVMCGDAVDDYFIFPVLLSVDTKSETTNEETYYWTEYTIANQPAIRRNQEWPKRNDKNGHPYVELKNKLELKDDDGESIEVPELYGIAPYLKLLYVLRKSLEKIGYSLEESPLDSDANFKNMCIIHPVIDACVLSELNYSDLLPDISLDEFLTSIENSFGLRFIADEVAKKVRPVFLKDLLIDNSYIEISPFLNDGYEIVYSEEKTLKLTVNRNIPESQPLIHETIEDIEKKYGPIKGSEGNLLVLSLYLDAGLLEGGVYLIRNSRMFYNAKKVSGKWTTEPVDRYLQDFFTENLELPYEEVSTGFASAPSVLLPMSGRTVKSKKAPGSGGVFQDIYGYMSEMSELIPSLLGDLLRRAPYLNDIQHINTVAKTTTTDDEGGTVVNYEEESDTSTPLYLCFSHGRYVAPYYTGELDDVFSGSQDAYTNDGTVHLDFDLCPPSLYKQFWKKHNELLQTSYHEVTVSANLSSAQLMSIRYDRPISINGQPVLPLSIQYNLSNNGTGEATITFRLIKPYSEPVLY